MAKEPTAAPPPGRHGVLARDALADAVRLRVDFVDAILSEPPLSAAAAGISRRDLMFAARLLDLEGAASLSMCELVRAIRSALRTGVGEERIDLEIQALVETLQLAGRPTAANGLLVTLRRAV